MKQLSVEHLFVKPTKLIIAGEEIEIKPVAAEDGLTLFGNLADEDKKNEAIKELVWLTIKGSSVYTDLPETRDELFKKMSFGSMIEWLNATIEANHLGDFVDKKKIAGQLSV